MLQQESIYNLLPKAKILPPKIGLHKSRYPYFQVPTATTFLLRGTSFPNIANMNGDISLPRGAHSLTGSMSTIGKPLGSYRLDPVNFIKKGHQYRILPPRESLRCRSQILKPSVPSRNDKPIMGLHSNKNFIYSNFVDVALMRPKKCPKETISFCLKKGYGEVPLYLSQRKIEVENEYKRMFEIENYNNKDETHKKLSDEELSSLREGLKKKLEMLNFEYGKQSHIKKYDSFRKISKKENLEKDMASIEKDIEKLNVQNVYVDYNQ